MEADSMAGLIIAASGNFPSQTHENIRDLVEHHGGKFESTNISDCTHLIATEATVMKKTRKVEYAKQVVGCEIVEIAWLLESITQKRALRAGKYRLTGCNEKSLASSKPRRSVRNNKRKLVEDSSEGEDDAAKKSRTAESQVNDGRQEVETKCSNNDEGLFEVLVDENDVLWDATLIGPSSCPAKYSVCRIQVLLDLSLHQYFTWYHTRAGTGPVEACREGLGQKSLALKAFERRFEEVSGLGWEKRHESPEPGKYIFIDSRFESWRAPSPTSKEEQKLSPTIIDVLKIILNKRARARMDALIEHISAKITINHKTDDFELRLHFGVSILRQLSTLLRQTSRKVVDHRVTALAQYFRKMMGDATAPCPESLSPESLTVASRASEMHANLSHLHCWKSIEKLLSASSMTEEPSWTRIYRLLGLKKMEPVSTTEFEKISEYYTNSFGNAHTKSSVVNIFAIERHGEVEQYAAMQKAHGASHGNRKLLWHGSKNMNFVGILGQGLRSRAVEPRSGTPNDGVYFADFAGKSLRYCDPCEDRMALMLLCEVQLGKIRSCSLGRTDVLEFMRRYKCTSICHEGNTKHKKWCDARRIHPDLKGIKMPDVSQGRTKGGGNLHYNEYVIFNAAQIRQRYLLQVKVD